MTTLTTLRNLNTKLANAEADLEVYMNTDLSVTANRTAMRTELAAIEALGVSKSTLLANA